MLIWILESLLFFFLRYCLDILLYLQVRMKVLGVKWKSESLREGASIDSFKEINNIFYLI